MKYPETARRLTEAMSEKRMTAQELSEKSGIGKSSISHYVNGTNRPHNLNAGAIAEVLGVNPLWLMGFDDQKHEVKTEHLDYYVSGINSIDDISKSNERGKKIQTLSRSVLSLNNDGLTKLIERAEELLEVPKYRKE